MQEKATTLNIRMSEEEKQIIKVNAEKNGKNISSYAREILLNADNENVSQNDTQNNQNVLFEKDERIADLKKQVEDYRNQIAQLHSIILVNQKENQLLIEQKTKKRWFNFWK